MLQPRATAIVELLVGDRVRVVAVASMMCGGQEAVDHRGQLIGALSAGASAMRHFGCQGEVDIRHAPVSDLVPYIERTAGVRAQRAAVVVGRIVSTGP